MSKIDRRKYRLPQGGGDRDVTRHEPIRAETFGGAEAVLAKIEAVRAGIVNRFWRTRTLLEVTIVNDPQTEADGSPKVWALWLGIPQTQDLVTLFGDETDAWVGQRVPVVLSRVQNPQTGAYTDKYLTASLDVWDDVLDELTADAADNAEAFAERAAIAESGGRKRRK